MSSAAEQLRSAQEQLANASAAVTIARERFLRHPNMKNEEAVEEAERGVRRAERFVDARRVALEEANEAERIDQQAKAREQRAKLLTERAELARRVRERMVEVTAVYDHLNEVVEAIDALMQEDGDLCQAFNALSVTADEHDKQHPLSVETVRLAVNFELGEAWDDKPRGDADVIEAVKATALLQGAGTSVSFYRQLETVVAEAEHAFGSAPLCRWLSTLREPPRDDHSPAAERARRAMRLRDQLKEAP